MRRSRPRFRKYPLTVWLAYLRHLRPFLLVGVALAAVLVFFVAGLFRGMGQFVASQYGLVPLTAADGSLVRIALGDESVWLMPPDGFARANDALEYRVARAMGRTDSTMALLMTSYPCPPQPALPAGVRPAELLPEPTSAFPCAYVTVTKTGLTREVYDAAFGRVRDLLCLRASVPAALTTPVQKDPARVAAAERLARNGVSFDLSRLHRERQNLLAVGENVVLYDTGVSGVSMRYGFGKTLAPRGELYEVLGVAHISLRIVYFVYAADCTTETERQAARKAATTWVFHTLDENHFSHPR